MKKFFLLLIHTILFVSCQQKQQKIVCNEVIGESFKGRVAIFFHKPISGSTYEIFFLPLCNNGFDSTIEEPSHWVNLGKGISISLPSDDSQFRILKVNAKKVNLKRRDNLGENLKSIYYCFADVEILCEKSEADEKERSKTLPLESGTLTVQYHSVSNVEFIVNSWTKGE